MAQTSLNYVGPISKAHRQDTAHFLEGSRVLVVVGRVSVTRPSISAYYLQFDSKTNLSTLVAPSYSTFFILRYSHHTLSFTIAKNMSIVPISDRQGTVSSPVSSDIWDPFKNFAQEFPFSLDLWDPFTDFPFSFHFPSFHRGIFPSVETQVSWRETPKAHVFRAFLPGLTSDQVIVFVDDDRMLQISSDDGKFMSRFKLPASAITDQVKASMDYGVVTVTVAKEIAPTSSNVRVVEITGE